MIIKMIALSPIGYVRDTLNIIDGMIVVISIVDVGNNFLFYKEIIIIL